MTTDIHARAEQLVRESRGKLTKADAYRELSRRGRCARQAKKAKAQPVQAWYIDN